MIIIIIYIILDIIGCIILHHFLLIIIYNNNNLITLCYKFKIIDTQIIYIFLLFSSPTLYFSNLLVRVVG